MFDRVDLKLIYPIFAEKAKQLVSNCAARGYYFWAIEGTRTIQRQKDLYAQGRTTPGHIVTNAKEYETKHQYGLAFDFCRDKDQTKQGLQPDWDIEAYKVLQEEAHKLGLISGLDWKSFREGPHVEYPINIPLSVLEPILKTQGLEAVWNFLNHS